ncbi:MAG: FtsX-like permease family protein [Acidobacteriaceae bacterium]
MKLKRGASLAHAKAEIDALLCQFAKERLQDFPRHSLMHLESVTSSILAKAGDTLVLLTAAVIMLLIIGCVNCSILLLARGMTRQGGLAFRAAIGASRYRILRQLIVEAIVLAVTGSLLGILLTYWMAKRILSLFPDVFMYESVIRINVPILAFSIFHRTTRTHIMHATSSATPQC